MADFAGNINSEKPRRLQKSGRISGRFSLCVQGGV